MAAIASTWSASSLSLSLCEDLDAPEPDNTCQVDHMVRGDGRGRRHEERHGRVGCGGCPFNAVAFVRGTVSSAGLPGPVAVTGEITSSRSVDDDPYAFPYHVQLECADRAHPCSLFGTLSEDGTLALDSISDLGLTMSSATLARTGDATCP